MSARRLTFWLGVAGVSVLANWGVKVIALKHPTWAPLASPGGNS